LKSASEHGEKAGGEVSMETLREYEKTRRVPYEETEHRH